MTAVIDLDVTEAVADAPPPPRAPRRRRASRPRRPRLQRPPLEDRRLVTLVALLVVVGLAGWLALHVLALGALSQTRAQDGLRAQLREQLAGQTAPLGTVDPGLPVGLLRIPTLGVEQVIVEGTASGDLRSGPGHRRDTALPGQFGVSVLYGKALTFGAPFQSIGNLLPGDGIEVTTAQGTFLYRVDGVRRGGDPALVTSAKARLTLVSVGVDALAPEGVLYVDATLQGDPVVGAGRVASVPASERALGVDAGGLPLLTLSLTVLLAGVVGVVALWRRMPAPVLWTLGAPVVLAGLWAVGAQAGRLLPNLL